MNTLLYLYIYIGRSEQDNFVMGLYFSEVVDLAPLKPNSAYIRRIFKNHAGGYFRL